MEKVLQIFFSYAHEDEDLMNEVRRQLIVYERNGQILKWHDRMITGGADWKNQIDTRLEHAHIILLFMSPHFIESRYCYEIEGQAALERQKSGHAKVIPIILRPCAWEATPFGAFQAFPTDAKPISKWSNIDEGSLNVAKGIMSVVDELSDSREHTNLADNRNPLSSPHKVKKQSIKQSSKFIYCKRCGHLAGKQSTCTGAYTHHEFVASKEINYCSRCGVLPGKQTTCTGAYTHHDFVSDNSQLVHCSRCGVEIGTQTTCTGAYTHHDFKKS